MTDKETRDIADLVIAIVLFAIATGVAIAIITAMIKF